MIQDLGRKFSQRTIIEHLNLEVRAGDFVSLLGSSGSGKSTLLRLIAGLDQPTSGNVKLADPQATRSFVFQESNLLPWRNLKQNLELIFELSNELRLTSDQNRDMQINEALETVGLSDDALKYPNQLSGGMRMRAAVARALLTKPRLLLLDEPFSALDENARFRLQEELYSIWRKQKMTVIFVTHSVNEAVFLSGRAIVLGRRPTQIIFDHLIQLPEPRDSEMRTSAAYISQIKIVSQSFSKGHN